MYKKNMSPEDIDKYLSIGWYEKENDNNYLYLDGF